MEEYNVTMWVYLSLWMISIQQCPHQNALTTPIQVVARTVRFQGPWYLYTIILRLDDLSGKRLSSVVSGSWFWLWITSKIIWIFTYKVISLNIQKQILFFIDPLRLSVKKTMNTLFCIKFFGISLIHKSMYQIFQRYRKQKYVNKINSTF